MKELDTALYSSAKSRRLWMALVLGSLAAIGPLSIDMYLPSLSKTFLVLHRKLLVCFLPLTASESLS
ncbi:hypothetical protein [Priestia abyssalis]|uniref:hypothetical protein n=1 Tax=Priestia abyssalis TaxID=1221450 RepID=UPI0009952893|nr:hypothetical protein [Priestia abyssalis]